MCSFLELVLLDMARFKYQDGKLEGNFLNRELLITHHQCPSTLW